MQVACLKVRLTPRSSTTANTFRRERYVRSNCCRALLTESACTHECACQMNVTLRRAACVRCASGVAGVPRFSAATLLTRVCMLRSAFTLSMAVPSGGVWPGSVFDVA